MPEDVFTVTERQVVVKVNDFLFKIKKEKEITKYELVEILGKKLEITIYFVYRRKELEVTFTMHSLDDEHFDPVRMVQSVIRSRKRGYDNEMRMFRLLSEWKKTHKFGIRDVYQSREYADNTLKADLMVVVSYEAQLPKTLRPVSGQQMMGLQIKSSVEYQEKHKRHHPFEPSIVVREDRTDEELALKFEIIKQNAVICQQLGLAISLLESAGEPVEKLRALHVLRATHKHLLHQ
jgi:hypothetical protein